MATETMEVKVNVLDLPEVKEQIGALKSLIVNKAAEAELEFAPEELQLIQVDWNSMVQNEGKIQIDGEEYITLAELRRLARLRGYVSSLPRVVQVPEYENHRNATIEWQIVWKDGTMDGACADASWRTVNKGFRNFPVAIASNRAEARCIRSALGIETCSFEEIGPEDEDLSGPANDQQKKAIEMLLARRKVSVESVVELFGETIGNKIVKDGKFIVNELSHQEAVAMMAVLNKPAKK